MEDIEIIALYWARNEDAITRTAEKYGRFCGSIARNVLQNPEDAEECVNDTWLSAWNSIPPRQPENLAAFLARLTRNRAIDRWRAQRSEKRGGGSVALALEELSEVLPGGEEPARRLEQQELIRSLNRFLATLPETERNVFLCRYWYLDGIAAISASFGFSGSKVKSMLHRTRKKLRQALQKEGLL